MNYHLGHRFVLGLVCGSLLAVAACAPTQPPVVVDLDSPIKDPAAPKQQKVELGGPAKAAPKR